MKSSIALALMAHPDDAEELCGGTLILLRERGWEVHILTMTPGDCGSQTLPPDEIASIRRKEATAAAASIGATYHCAESRDNFIVFDEATLRRTLAIVRRIAPTLVFTHSPIDYMVDHEVTSQIARSVTFSAMVPNASEEPVRPGTGVPALYYVDPMDGVDHFGVPIMPSLYVDISDRMEQKAAMLNHHQSQVEWLKFHHGMDDYAAATREWNRRRGGECGCLYAEAFRQHRGHGYPQDCVLSSELAGRVRRGGG